MNKIIKDIPDYEEFLTVEELNRGSVKLTREHPSVVELSTVGRSRAGDPIQALIIGEGKQTAFLFGTPHPNEPIGAMMIEFLSRKLAEDDEFREWTGFRWVLIKCADSDGTRLNEGWFKGPFTPLHYAENFYRPPHFQQVEWSFPVSYKRLKFNSPIPETRAIMRVVDKEKPAFMYSLHNAGFGGAYYYVSNPCEPLYERYRKEAINQKIPLHLGEPEMPYAKKLSEAVYLMPTVQENYDYLEKYTDKDPIEVIKGGAGSTEYARQVVPDVFSLVCEVPYFYDSRIDDLREADVKRRDVILHSIELSSKMFNFLKERYRTGTNLLTVPSKFKEAIEENLRRTPAHLEAKRKWAESTAELEALATISQEFDNYVITRFYGMLSFGMFIRMIDYQLRNTAKTQEKGKLEDLKLQVEEELEKHNRKLLEDLNYEVIPIKRLVAVQLAAALATIEYLKEREVRG
ncbi:peptidase M14 [Candidatus Bipolaricaulota bacterium]|nr:peptidase M14 [Candidatus Bipolaricaulota bacterium]